ncbi:MAG: DUF4435 domain-containing protein [Dysgonomonas sp.]|uniref:DUF4435 domain-containing protein n=1 Tax=Dysgonomonas sp. TaxID=1891233 RepID=UPI0039E3B0B4
MGLANNITLSRIVNSIMIKSKGVNRSFVIVEGKSDFQVFSKFVKKEDCSIEIAFGNENVINIINELKSNGFRGCLGIIDSDFKFLDDELIVDENIFHTDYHDIEIMIIKSNCFEIVLSGYVQDQKLKDKYIDYDGFRAYLFSITRHLGYIKWLNKKHNLGLIFKPNTQDGKHMDYSNFISPNDLSFLGHEKLVESILNYCNGKVKISIKKEELLAELRDFIQDCQLDHLCNGHDIIHIISLSLRKNISNLNAKSISAEQLSRDFYLAYEARHFTATHLYQNIKNWEARNNRIVLDF